MTWVDTPWPQDPKQLKADGYDIMRYLCSPWNTGPGTSMPNKRLERPELDGYIAAGVDVAVNFEDAADDCQGGYDRGKEKGQRAGDWMLNQLDWPAGGVCCSSIDMDIGVSWGGLPQAYQFGFRDGLTSTGPYFPGIYGPSIALNGANDDGTAHMFWLTAASFWSHGIQPRIVHLRQNGYWPFGSDADLNVTVLEPIGSYLHPLGDDMAWTDAQVKAALDGISSIGHAVNVLQTALANLTNLEKDTNADVGKLQQIVADAVAAALAGGVPVATIEQGVANALAGATIPVVLTGHAGSPPAVTP